MPHRSREGVFHASRFGFRKVKETAASLSEGKRISRAAGVIGFYTLLSRILGLVRDMVLASLFGSGMAADAFFVAFRIPNLLRRLLAEGSLTISFIPVFTEYLETRTREQAFELARITLTLLALLLTAVTLAGVIFSPWIVRIQAFGFGSAGDKYELTVLLTRIVFPYIFLVSLVAFFMGVLNSLRHFAAPAAAPIFLNLGIVGAAFLVSPHLAEPIVGVALGVLIGGILQVLLQLPWVVREGLKLAPRWMPVHPAVQRIGRLMLPAVFGSAVYQLNQFIGTLLASFLPEGSISWLYYADRLVQFPLGVFAIAISTAALPSLASQAARHQVEEFGRTLGKALSLVFFITLPSMVGLMILAQPIVSVFFQRGAFDAHAARMTAWALLGYGLGLGAFSGSRVLVSAFYALQDTKTPVKVAVVALLINLGCSLLLMGPLRHAGLALALSLAASFQFLLLVRLLRARVPVALLGSAWRSTGKSALAAALMGLCLWGLAAAWDPGSGTLLLGFRVAVLVLAGVLIYFPAAWLLGSPEARNLASKLKPPWR